MARMISSDWHLLFADEIATTPLTEAAVRAATWTPACVVDFGLTRANAQVQVADRCFTGNRAGSTSRGLTLTIIADLDNPLYVALLDAFKAKSKISIWEATSETAATARGFAAVCEVLTMDETHGLDAQSNVSVSLGVLAERFVDVMPEVP